MQTVQNIQDIKYFTSQWDIIDESYKYSINYKNFCISKFWSVQKLDHYTLIRNAHHYLPQVNMYSLWATKQLYCLLFDNPDQEASQVQNTGPRLFLHGNAPVGHAWKLYTQKTVGLIPKLKTV